MKVLVCDRCRFSTGPLPLPKTWCGVHVTLGERSGEQEQLKVIETEEIHLCDQCIGHLNDAEIISAIRRTLLTDLFWIKIEGDES